eukprot:TRINITY_DN8026_c0_g1_i2.p2 TRINITY_DN8026_c0_g1~~TRINITY_DN8026_c0_g1_i2.p2  ORF type:complete len:456 (+),score=178.92 TRINITY_DN8026_c0_g1_i2:85-1452(+)
MNGSLVDISFTSELFRIVTQDPALLLTWLVDEVQSNPAHVMIEVACIAFIVYMWRQKPFIPDKKPPGEEPTPQEKQDMIDAWCKREINTVPDNVSFSRCPDRKLPFEERVVLRSEGDLLTIKGVDGPCKDYSSFNYLRLAGHERVVEDSLAAVDHYGVGSCGPRGFYGTVQPHLVLEEKLKDVFDTPAAIIYSFQYSTTASIIPAFSQRKDVLIVDKGVNMAIATGVELSRSTLVWYEHNDMDDLEQKLAEVAQKQAKSKKLTRRWIVTEGVFRNFGDMAPLDRIVELKQKYKFRLVLDDSFGMGALGATGRGTPEEFGIPTKECDVYVGSMDSALGSVGGFCVGSNMVVDHQRLSSAGYCFSASLPPFSAVASTTALNIMLNEPQRVAALRNNAEAMRSVFTAEGFVFPKHSDRSPIIHLRFKTRMSHRASSCALYSFARTCHAVCFLHTTPFQ